MTELQVFPSPESVNVQNIRLAPHPKDSKLVLALNSTVTVVEDVYELKRSVVLYSLVLTPEKRELSKIVVLPAVGCLGEVEQMHWLPMEDNEDKYDSPRIVLVHKKGVSHWYSEIPGDLSSLKLVSIVL